ncbi:MAG TPA: hypothetical protein PLK06_00920, partial [bacterium]|nr:hypothetical protein [bacterium]
MYDDVKTFVPFNHEKAEIKNSLIEIARKQDRATVEGALAATMIYANLVDYLGGHLLENLRRMISIYTFQKFGGVFHADYSKAETNIPLGKLIKELQSFEFPQKNDFIAQLKGFSKLRNRVMHELMKLDTSDPTQDMDTDITRIAQFAEQILEKYNVLTTGVAAIWNLAQQQPGSDNTPISPMVVNAQSSN